VFISLRYGVSVSVSARKDIDEVIDKVGERRERIIDFEIVGVEGNG
jgi:hypothetical protein